MSSLPEDFFVALKTLGIAETPRVLWVSVAEQRLRLFANALQVAEYPISTAKNGVGCRRDSYQTPIGLHRVAQKIGGGQPAGMIFKERKPTKLWKSPIPNPQSPIEPNRQSAIGNRRSDDLILTRILWLEGLQPGLNQDSDVDSFSRYIYLHGTNHEEQIGQPASHGCVRMRNEDVVKLFDDVAVGTLVWIG